MHSLLQAVGWEVDSLSSAIQALSLVKSKNKGTIGNNCFFHKMLIKHGRERQWPIFMRAISKERAPILQDSSRG